MTIRLAADRLHRFARDILVAAGCTAGDAELWAETLVWANLRGVDSHGVLRIPRYLEWIRLGDLRPRADITLLRAAGAIVLLDADRAPGPVAMARAMDEAIGAARRVHVGWCVARSITHAGAVGHFALRAAAQGMAGIVMTASGPLMAWPGSRGAVVSTNPVAIAVPAGAHPPLLLDMATATVALGKIMSAKQSGQPVPPDWGVDADGRPTTDPAAVQTLLPMGGPKGAGLSLMIECLASLVAGNPVIAPALAGRKGSHMNGVAIALDLAAFGAPDAFAADVQALASAVATQPRADGAEALLLPGQRGDAEAERRRADGIPIPPGVWKQLVEAAEQLGVTPP